MKKLMVAIAGAVALTCSAFADATSWFNGGVEQGWPNSAVGGAWSNTTEQTEYTAGTLTVEADAETPVAFNATDAKTIGGDAKTVTVSSTVKFTPFEELPEVPENAKAAVVAIKDGNFWILESDMDADPVTNKWTETDIPTTANAVAVTVCISEGLADYKIGDSAVIQANMVFEGSISAANYIGDGEITSLTATYEANVVTLKLPADPANVGSVIVSNVTDGVAVEKKDGVYTFPYGANAQVWIYAKEGYLFANGENFKKYDETMTANKDYSSETPENPTEAEAKIGTKYYLTLNAAFDAAKSKDTVYLLKDYTETIELPAKTITFDYQDRKITTTGKCFILQSGSHIALSGNGAAVTSTGSVAIRFADGTDGASFTVDRGSYVGYNGAVAFGKSKNCTITINGGQFEAKDDSVIAGNGTADCGNNTLTIKDARLVGEIETEGYIACGIYWPCSGTVTVESTIIGLIKGGCGVCSRAGTVKLADDVTIEYGKVGPGEVEGWIGDNKNIVPGVSVYFDYAAAYPGYAAGDTIKAMDTEELTVAKGQIWFAADGEGYRSLGRKEDAQAKIGTTFYLTFAEALSKMTGGEVVELCKDIDLGKTSIAATANGMIDLAGYTITGKVGASDKYLFSISKGAQVTFTNGTFEAEEAAKFTTFFHNYGNLVLADLSLDAKYLTGSNEYSDGANVIACMNGTISVAGSTEIVNNEGFALSVGNHAADYPSRAVTLDTTGNLSGDFRFCGGSVTCLAATFDDDAKFYYGCACNTSTPKNNSCYADADIAGFAGLVARVGEDPALVQTQYYTILGELYLGLDAAIADAEAGDKITLVNPVTVATLTVGKNCTIDLNGQLFTANGAVALDADVKLVNSKQAGLFAPNGVVTIAADKVLDLSEMPFGSTQYGIEGTGSITITSGAEAKFYKWNVPMVDSANWMYANMPAFFTGGVIPVGGKVTIGDTTWTGTENGFEVPGTVAFAQIDAKGQMGLEQPDIVVNECYTSLDAALAAVKVGGTVTLADNIVTAKAQQWTIDKNITIDFADKKITKTVANDWVFTVADGADAIFTGTTGGIVHKPAALNQGNPASMIQILGKLTVNGGAYESDFTVFKVDEEGPTKTAAGELVVNGGTFTITAEPLWAGKQTFAVMNWSKATINGGTWNGPIVTRSCDGNTVSKAGTTDITAALAGNVSYQLRVGYGDDTTCENVPKIKGVEVTNVELVKVDGIEEDLYLVKSGEYVTVSDSVEARIGTKYYLTLNEALDAAKADDTVTLCKDITTDAAAPFVINKNIELHFSDYTVTKTVANHYTFDIPNGVTVYFNGTMGGVKQTASNLNPTSPASMIRNKGNLTIVGGVYESDFCIIKNDEDPGAGVLTVVGGTFKMVRTAGGYTGIQMALMNWATAVISGGNWDDCTIGTRSCDGNAVSKAGTTTINGLGGIPTYLLYVGSPGDTTYANVPKIKGEGVDIEVVTLGQVSTITDELELVEDGDWVTVAKKEAEGPYTPGTGGGTVEPTEIPGVYEVTPDPSSGIVTIAGGLSETDTIIVTITNDFTIVGVPEDQIEIILNDIVVPNTAFVGGDENGFSTALDPDGEVDGVPVKPTLIEETETEKPFVVGESVETTVQAIPGLTYKLMRGDEPGAYPTQADKQSAGEEAETITLTDADKPADKAFYVIQVEK